MTGDVKEICVPALPWKAGERIALVRYDAPPGAVGEDSLLVTLYGEETGLMGAFPPCPGIWEPGALVPGEDIEPGDLLGTLRLP